MYPIDKDENVIIKRKKDEKCPHLLDFCYMFVFMFSFPFTEGTEDIMHNELNPNDLPEGDGIILFHDQVKYYRYEVIPGCNGRQLLSTVENPL